MIDRGFLSWLSTHSTNQLDLYCTWNKYSLKIEPNVTLNRINSKVNLHNGRHNPKAVKKQTLKWKKGDL